MNQLIHKTSPTLVLHQLGWGIPQAMWRNHAYEFYLVSITNGNGNTKFSLAWTLPSQRLKNVKYFQQSVSSWKVAMTGPLVLLVIVTCR